MGHELLCQFMKHHQNGSVEAKPGYFALTLDTGVRAEMTVANHTALYRFAFPESPQGLGDSKLSPVILTELTSLAGAGRSTHIYLNKTTGRITGSGTFTPSFGTGQYEMCPTESYFYAYAPPRLAPFHCA